jgi:glutamine synthetase
MDNEYKAYLLNNARAITEKCEKEVYDMMHYSVQQIRVKLDSDLACTQQTEHLINNPTLKAINKVALLYISAYEMADNNGFLSWVCCRRLKIKEIEKLKTDLGFKTVCCSYEHEFYEFKKDDLKITVKKGLVKVVDYGMHIDELVGID